MLITLSCIRDKIKGNILYHSFSKHRVGSRKHRPICSLFCSSTTEMTDHDDKLSFYWIHSINGTFDTFLKGKFPHTTMWIGWVESNFTNPTVKVWADLDNPFKRSDYAKLCMSPSLAGTRPEYVISQEDNSPLTLYIDFHNFQIFLDINSPFDPVHS